MKRIFSVVFICGLLGSSAAIAGDLKVKGFVDPQLRWNNSAGNAEGFVIQDAAIYVNQELGGGVKFGIDLPFVGGQANNDFAFAQTKAQAYVSAKHSFGLEWTAGQFDSIYGVEANDSPDLLFTRVSVVSRAPATHTGLLLGYEVIPGLSIRAIAANPNEAGTSRGNNLEYGGQLVYNEGGLRGTGGALVNKQGTETLTKVFVNAGIDLGELSLDAEVNSMKPAGAAEAGLGVLGQAKYGLTEELNLGGRVGYGSKLIADTTALEVTVGPQYRFTDHLTLKSDYTLLNIKPSAGDATKFHAVALSAVLSF